jgi:DNA repair exonuclease SbcCD ATPase subunit
MRDRILRFSDLHVGRVPGVAAGGQFTLQEFSPDVNLIFGPNGSGKTLMGRSLLALLWPRHTRLTRPTISGKWTLDGHLWAVNLDGGHPTWRRDGASADPPALPPGEFRTHHWLGLKELLVDDGPDGRATNAFAQRIAREMLGGYDLDTAASSLRFSDRPSRPMKAREAYESARNASDEARANERELHDRAEALEDLRKRSAAATAADEDVRRLERALEYRDAADQFDQVERELAEYDEALNALRGDEREHLEKLRTEHRARVAEQLDARRRLEEADAARSQTALPDDGVPDDTLATLDSEADSLAERARSLAEANEKRASFTAERDARRAAIGDTTSDAAIVALAVVPTERMERYANDIAVLRAEQARLDVRERELEQGRARLEENDDDGNSSPSLDTVRRGLDALSQWLATPAPPGSTGRGWSVALLVAAGSIAILIVLLAVLNHPMWFVGVIVAGPFIWHARPTSGGGPPTDHRSTYEQDYARMHLPQPSAWTLEAVRTTLEALTQQWARLESTAAAIRQFENSTNECDRLADEVAASAERSAAERKAIESALGFSLGTERDDWLHVLGTNLAAWHKAHADVEACCAKMEQIEHDIEQALTRFNDCVRPYLDTTAGNAGEARGLQRDLASRAQRHREARQKLIAARRDIERTTTETERLDGEYESIFTGLGLEPDDATTLNDWLDQLDRYRALQQEVRDARILRDRLADELSEYPHWLERDRAALESDLERARRGAAELVNIEQEIGGITREIDNAKRAHNVEDAMRRVDDARDTLLRDRENAERAAVGDAIVSLLRAESSGRTLPAVMRKAISFFQRITHGRFVLRLVEHDGTPTFAAWDTRDELQKSLDQLSAGECVQLLLSVRLGFLEQEEAGVRLPIVLDETLGTTDDERAGAVIDAVVEICRTGRQVFYLTAQPDEVGKWISRLESESDITLKEFDLARLRNLAEADATPLVIQRPELPPIPKPDGLHHEAYGQRLGVPGLNPCGTVGAVHLWHLIDDPGLLHTLLERRVRSWGPFENLTLGNAGVLPGVERSTIERSHARARAIQAAFNAWRIGRGKSVDRTVLEESKAVSGTFIDRVIDLVESCKGDASAVIAELDGGHVNGWRKSKTEQLRSYFEGHGYLDQECRLSRDEIYLRVLAEVGRDLEASMIDNTWLDRMIASLPDLE